MSSGLVNLRGLARNLRYFNQEEHLTSFAGGLNLRDDLLDLAPSESPNLWNVTMDEAGGVLKRNGYSRWNASAASNVFTFAYYSKLLGLLFWYSQSDGKLYSDPGTGVLTLRKTFTTGSPIQIVDFVGKAYAIHPADGLFSSSDGVTWAAVTAASGSVPKGSLLLVWQNKLWVSGDTAAVVRVYFCAPGDATKWASADGAGFVDIRDKDDAPVVCLFGGSGVDFQSKPSLLVFKEDSFYRIVDSVTGAYVSLDGKVGAASANSVVTVYGKILFLSKRGVHETNGVSGAVSVTEKLAPLFSSSRINFGKQTQFCAGYRGDRVYFSLTRAGSTTNDLAIEYHPLLGWATVNSNAMGCYVTYATATEKLLGASPTVAGRAYELLLTGGDDGAAIKSWFVTKPSQPAGGMRARLQALRVNGRGNFDVSVIPDFATAGQRSSLMIGASTGAVWDVDKWDIGVWATSVTQGDADLHPRVTGKAFQIRIDETSTKTTSEPAFLDAGAGRTVGAWALYGLLSRYTPLGLS